VYEDDRRAEAYDQLEFPGTYYLAFRDLPALFKQHIAGKAALDFGCGAGRSTRFLKQLGYETIGIDIAEDMLRRARTRDPEGSYLLLRDDEMSELADQQFDLIFSAFTFDNIPTDKQKLTLFKALAERLTPEGKLVNLVSSPEIYTHEWASFTTKDFPENKRAQSGDTVKIVMTDVEDKRPVIDVVWSDEAYRDLYTRAGLTLVLRHAPLGHSDEPYHWVSETTVAPWVIYILDRA
ncbi:class I SAM-dependent methyltransferase, partial [bacterium]|nr:class I SAM-dependent methyltransferase [bacterium]